MNKTSTLVGIIAGLTGAGMAYGFKSKDTIKNREVANFLEGNLNAVSPSVRFASELKTNHKAAIGKCRELIRRFRDELGIPGVVVGVSVDGKTIWEEGFGYANIETRTPCHADSAMRIASISKPITMALLAKLYETRKVDLDNSVHSYVPYFPKKKVDGEEVDITIRQLASHTAGVRHYRKKGEAKENSRDSGAEFYLKEKFHNIEKSIDLFKDDELLFKPGTSFEYTTHGYTLLSAVIENVGKKPFTEQIQDFFKLLGLEHTHLDKIPKIIYGRVSYYDKDKHGRIVNAELADTSYKWAGGGFISTVGDLIKFGDSMLYCYQQNSKDKPGYLKKETLQEIWKIVDNTTMKWGFNSGYGLGWTVVPKEDEIGGVTNHQKFHVGHSGGAVGASSILLILPRENFIKYDENNNEMNSKLPQGITVAILVNLENVSCRVLAKAIAEEFYNV